MRNAFSSTGRKNLMVPSLCKQAGNMHQILYKVKSILNHSVINIMFSLMHEQMNKQLLSNNAERNID